MLPLQTQIGLIIFYRLMQLVVWLLFCCAVTAVVAVIQWISKKRLVRWTIKIAACVTVGIIILMLAHLIYVIMYSSMWLGIWLTSCLIVTIMIVLVQLINKKFRKKKPIHWAIKLAGCAAFYMISFLVFMRLLGSYPGNWLGTDKEYRELAYELFHLNLNCYEYEEIYEGSNGEIVLEFEHISHISDHVLERTLEQKDYIMIKTAVQEYIKENICFQGKRIDISFRLSSQEPINAIYNFDPRTGEMGKDTPYWFVTNAQVNNFTELAEFYDDFAGISCVIYSTEGIQDITNLCNLTYLELYISGTCKEKKDFEKYYLEELNTLLPDCEIYLN